MTDSPQKRPRSGSIGRHGFASIAASLCVLAATLGFYVYSIGVNGRDRAPGYSLSATFLSSNGLTTGADVMLAGVAIGSVTSITLDPVAMVSRVRFTVDDAIRLPTDTRLSIGSASLTSANALMVAPGKAASMLAAGATVTDTCELTSLEQQVSQYIFGNGGAATGCGG